MSEIYTDADGDYVYIWSDEDWGEVLPSEQAWDSLNNYLNTLPEVRVYDFRENDRGCPGDDDCLSGDMYIYFTTNVERDDIHEILNQYWDTNW